MFTILLRTRLCFRQSSLLREIGIRNPWRDEGSDLTGWLEYFVTGLEARIIEALSGPDSLATRMSRRRFSGFLGAPFSATFRCWWRKGSRS